MTAGELAVSTPVDGSVSAVTPVRPTWPWLDRPLPVPVLAGTLTGIVYGAALRGWMRLVTSDPEFTWSGTGFIVVAFTVLGTMAGLAAAGRWRGWRRGLGAVRAVGTVLSLMCFMAAGALMFPTIVPAGLGVARTDWPRPLRTGLVVVGGLVAVAVVMAQPDLSIGRRVVALALYLALCAVEVRLVVELYAPTAVRRHRPGSRPRLRRIAVPVAAVLGGLLLLGIAGIGV